MKRLPAVSLVVLGLGASSAVAHVPPNAPPPVPNVTPSGPARHGPPATPQEKTFVHLSIEVTTGKDDLRGDSSATAEIHLGRDVDRSCVLKGLDADGWSPGSVHTATCNIPATVFSSLRLAPVDVMMQSFPHGFETPDNWDIARVVIKAFNEGETATCVYDASGWPLVRLKGGTPDQARATVTGSANHC